MSQAIQTTPAYKSAHGWQAESIVPLDGPYQLRITTLKHIGGKLATTAKRVKVSDDGMSYRFIMFGDFHEHVICEAPARITEKATNEQHQRALQHIDAIKARCKAHYTNETAAI